MAVALPLFLTLLFGIWDVGRIIEVQQLLSNAARDAARQAAIGSMLDPTTGAVVDVTAADVQQAAVNYLTRNGVNTAGINVQFADLTNAGATDPYEAAQLDHLRITVQLPAANIRLLLVNGFTDTNVVALTGAADWFSMRDSNVNVQTTLPTD
jgi:Flp pilus assembly protein TadG